jgi:hypothetical protein
MRDDGYGVRNYGVALALGYDWLAGALDAEKKQRILTAWLRWVEAFDQKGFGRNHPQGNYFAGWYAAKGLGGFAMAGEHAKAQAQLDEWLGLHRSEVAPYYAAWLTGGGWPEGWNYGPLGTTNMILPVLSAKRARGLDLIADKGAPFRFPVEQALHVAHFTWPSRLTMDDRGAQYAGANPSGTRASLFALLAQVLVDHKHPDAAAFHRYAREVVDADDGPEQLPPWQRLLFWDDRALENDYRIWPRSYLAKGMQTVAMRSSWEKDAVWASFTAGPYVGNPDSGEMYFDQGSLAVVRGGRALLVNPPAALQRHSPGTEDGEGLYDAIYEDLFGNNDVDASKGNRTLFNIFYVKGKNYGQIPTDPKGCHVRVGLYEDGGTFVRVRGDKLEEAYRRPGGKTLVASWTRQVTYVRPNLFIIEDRTRSGDPSADQWLAFHVGGAPVGAGSEAYELQPGKDYAGRLTPLLPRGRKVTVEDLFKKKKVYRVSIRPGQPGAEQRWLTVFDAAARPAEAADARLMQPGDALLEGELEGLLLRRAGDQIVVLSAASPGKPLAGRLRYRVPQSATLHVVSDLPPSTAYKITVAASGGQHEIGLAPDAKGKKSSREGSLTFYSTEHATLSDSPPLPPL